VVEPRLFRYDSI